MKNPNSASANVPTCVEDDGDRVEEDDLDVEDDEEHRRQVEAHREALLLAAGRSRRPTRTASAGPSAAPACAGSRSANETNSIEAGIAAAKSA